MRQAAVFSTGVGRFPGPDGHPPGAGRGGRPGCRGRVTDRRGCTGEHQRRLARTLDTDAQHHGTALARTFEVTGAVLPLSSVGLQ